MPYCWKCGEPLPDAAAPCPACGATADDRRPLPDNASDEARALRAIYDRYGCKQVLTRAAILYNALGDFLGEDGHTLRQQVRTAMGAGLGRLYLAELTFSMPTRAATAMALITDIGFTEDVARHLIALFDDMTGLPRSEAASAPAKPTAPAKPVPPVKPKPAAPVASIPPSQWGELQPNDTNDKQFVFGSQYLRSSIRTITFHNSFADKPADAWDVSNDRNGTVWAWVQPTAVRDSHSNVLYDLVIAGDGGVRLPKNSRSLFSNYRHVVSIDSGNCVDTSSVINMFSMFNKCSALTSLNLSSFDTSNVTDMSWMFAWCQALTTLDPSSFDTSSVINMFGMFSNCSALTSLNLSSFDTSSVTDMRYMFNGCHALTAVTASQAFIIPDDADTFDMFSACPLQSISDFTIVP